MNLQDQVILSNAAFLREKDNFMANASSIDGQLTLTSTQLVFTPAGNSTVITIKLSEIKDADFTNILAKLHFIVTTTSDMKYIFGLAKNENAKNREALKYVFLPGYRYLYQFRLRKQNFETMKLGNVWKENFLKLIPNSTRTRKELSFINVFIGSIIGIVILFALLFGLILLLS